MVTFPRQCSMLYIWEVDLNCWMLLLATCSHTPYHLHPFYFLLLKPKDLVAKQHPTNGQNSPEPLYQQYNYAEIKIRTVKGVKDA